MYIEEESDLVLLRRVATRDVDPRAARDAEAAFYRRHVRYLYGVLRRRVARPFGLSDAAVEDLVQDTFCRAFERAATFQDGGVDDPVRCERRTRAWLGRIAQRLVCDSLNRIREVPANPQIEEMEARSEPAVQLSAGARRVQDALATLSEREQDVLRVSATYFRAGERHQRLPNAVCAELAQRWRVSPENVRAIRSRAMKKLKQHLLDHPHSAEEA